MTCIKIPNGVVCVQPDYKPGDQAPEGYLSCQIWAETQHKAGLRQKECGRCGKWKYPQELSVTVDRCEMQSRKGPITVATPVCNACAEKQSATPAVSGDANLKKP